MRQSQQLQKPGVGGGGRIQSQTSVQYGCFHHCCKKLSCTARAKHRRQGDRELGKILYWITSHSQYNKATWLFKSLPPPPSPSIWSAKTIILAFHSSIWRRFWQNQKLMPSHLSDLLWGSALLSTLSYSVLGWKLKLKICHENLSMSQVNISVLSSNSDLFGKVLSAFR